MAVSKRTRFEVLRRDNHTCRYCGGTAPDVVLTIDHVVPVALGGTDEPENLVAACRDCNYGKTSTSPDGTLVADVKSDALRWSAAMKLAAHRVSMRDEPLREYLAHMEDAVLQYFDSSDLPADWRESIGQFYRAGLPVEMAERAVDIAVARSNVNWRGKWKYACGIAWSMVREIQNEARAIVEESN